MKKTLPLLALFALSCTSLLKAQTDINFQEADKAYNSSNYTLAEDYYTRYINTFEDKLPDYFKKIKGYDTASAYEKATLFSDFSIHHNWAVAYYKRGMCYLNNDNYVQAGKDFDMSIQIDANYAEPYYQKGLLLKSKGKYESCKYFSKAKWLSNDTLKAARSEYMDNFCWMCADEFYIKGKTEVELKQFPEALKNLNLAITYCHDSGNFYAYRGIAYEGLEKLDSAIADYTYAIKLDSNNSVGYYRRALTYEKSQKYKEAFNDLTKAITINPRFANAYLHQAMDCEFLDMADAALYDYQQVLRLKPTEGIAWYKIGLHKKQNGEDACSYFQKAADLGCDDAQPYADECKKEAERKAMK